MTKYQEVDRYLVFWETREDSLPTELDQKIPFLATLMKMIEEDETIIMWGRCRGKIKENRFYYTGFVIFESDIITLKETFEKYDKYITLTSKHKFTNILETKNFLMDWKQRQNNKPPE